MLDSGGFMNKVVVIGGGPAGMMAAGEAAAAGCEVTLLEKNSRLGRKLSITGKGRCNITNACDNVDLLSNTPSNPNFLRAAFSRFTSAQTMAFFEELGVNLVIERGRRVFPESGKAADIVSAMEKHLISNKVKIKLNANVTDIDLGRDKVIKTTGSVYQADRVILAAGGLCYPATGSTGDGYRFAEKAGHTVTRLFPSLAPMSVSEPWVLDLQGLTLKNVKLVMHNDKGIAYEGFGELLFTHFGVSGPIILSASRFFTEGGKHTLCIDLKPALDEHVLDARVLSDFQKYKNKNFTNALDELLPRALIPVIISLSGIDPDKKINSITKAERKALIKLIKCLKLSVSGILGFENAVVTRGGVNVKEINPSTMESKIVKGLFFAGEILDVDAMTGGYNLQIALSTGYTAGRGCGGII